jgi:hypothetical protein
MATRKTFYKPKISPDRPQPKKRGREAERVKIEGDCEEAMKKALKAPPQKKK